MLPSLPLLERIQQTIKNITNKQGEYKRKTHYCCYLLCEKAGLRASEAINFDLSTKNKHGLYRLNKTKGRKKRYVYIPQPVISELKKHDWKPNHTNRFNFYHFLRKIKRELNLPANIELTPHTLRRAFATYHAESGLPLPLLSKLLGHKSVRTTALYWMNIYHGGDDGDDKDIGSILAGKFWLERPRRPWPEPEAPVRVKLNELPRLTISNSLTSEQPSNYLSKIQQLTEKDQKITELTSENETLQNNLSELSHQKSYETNQRKKVQQDLAEAKQTINQLTQDLAYERKISTEQGQTSHNLRQQLRNELEISTDLANKIHAYEQNLVNLQNAYQNAIKDKEKSEKQLNQLTNEIKNAVYLLSQWQKFNHYKHLEQERNELKTQIVQPPPWK